MAILINQKNCSTTRKNLGLANCVVQEGQLTGLILVPDGWSLDLSTDTFNKTYVNNQIQAGNFIPILGAFNVAQNTPEATTEEAQGGIMSVVRNGLPMYTFTFKKGWYFSNALSTYNSNQAYDVLFTFSSGAVAGATDGTLLTGFNLGMLNNGTYMFNDGAAEAYNNLSIQLIDELQFNTNVALLDRSVLDFNVNSDIRPIYDILMVGNADVSDNKIYFTAVFESNQSAKLLGLSSSNVKHYVDGTAGTISGFTYNSATGKYSFTPSGSITTSSDVIVELYDTVNSVAVAEVDGKYYKGATTEFNPVA